MLLRLRLYFLYFFRQKTLRRLGYIYSHFILSHGIGGLSVSIFYYDARLEASWDEISRRLISFKVRRALNVYDISLFQRFYFLLLLLLLLNSLILSRLKLKGIVRHFLRRSKRRRIKRRKTKAKQHLESLKLKRFLMGLKNIQETTNNKFTRFIPKRIKRSRGILKQRRASFTKTTFRLFARLLQGYFIRYLHSHVNFGAKRGSRSRLDYEGFSKAFYYIGVSQILSRPFFYHLGQYFSCIISHLSIFSKSQINFFLISNLHVTAGFLANYIAQRFKQGYSLRELINPLRRELSRVKRASKNRFRQLVKKATLSGSLIRLNYASVFSRSLFFLFSTYRGQSFYFYANYASFVSYEFFFTFFSLAKDFFSNNYQKFFVTSASFLQCRFSGVLRTLFLRQPQTLFFYRLAQANLYGSYVFLPLFYPGSNTLMRQADYYFFLREMLDSFISNFSFLLGSNSFSLVSQNISTYSVYKALNIGLKGFTRYLRFNILKFNLNQYFNILKINRKKFRISERKQKVGLLGFKFHLKGRFTRKQIAASHVFRRGPLPLSTMKANIDYAFSTVALKNSAVGIKVWLYKADKFNNFYFKTI